MKKKIGTAGIYLLCFLCGYAASFFLEIRYVRLVQSLFDAFQDDKVTFGKFFHLFPSSCFSNGLGVFFALSLWLMKRSSAKALTATCMIIVFFATTVIVSYFGSQRFVLECATCYNGRKRLNYPDIDYDSYFVTSLIIASALALAINGFAKPHRISFEPPLQR